MKETLSRLYRLQVLADQLRTTNRRKTELDDLRQLNHRDYDALHKLLKQQSAGLDEALRLKVTIYREMNNGCSQISRIRRAQSLQTKKIDFRSEVLLDKRLTSSQNTLMIKFRELNQLLWQLGEPLHHPTYLHAHQRISKHSDKVAFFEVIFTSLKQAGMSKVSPNSNVSVKPSTSTVVVPSTFI